MKTQYILSAAIISGLEIEQPPFEFGVTNKSPEFTQKFPLGRIPAFEDIEGFKVTEGMAIARYVSSLVPEAGLPGRNAKETAQIDQWIHFAETEIQTPASNIYIGIGIKYLPGFNEEQRKYYQERVEFSLKFLEDYLASCPSAFLVNNTITLADIVLALSLRPAGQTVCGMKERKQVYPYTFAYFAKVNNDERIKHLFGESGFIDGLLTFKPE
ncbi:glutathione S-transferase C-terminal-like protein [Pisolithus marmoratus]|nr:glutathione S-transferase C-terminal-like protein [Pisolithus marmoratus]